MLIDKLILNSSFKNGLESGLLSLPSVIERQHSNFF